MRLRNAFYVTATDAITDENGNVIEVHATYDPDSEGGTTPDGRRVRSTVHWVSATHAIDRTVHLYDRLFLPHGGPPQRVGTPPQTRNQRFAVTTPVVTCLIPVPLSGAESPA